MSRRHNPFERFDIDPRLGPRAITERLRELAEDAGPDERAAIRAAWEELTLHPAGRLKAALAAHPESRAPLGSPPNEPADATAAALDPNLGPSELLARPSVARALGPGPRARPAAPDAPAGGPALDDDPILKRAIDVR